MCSFVKINKIIRPFNKIINVPGDKSISIRAIILNSQSIGESKIFNLLESEDVKNTILTMKKLGVKIIKKKNYHNISGVGLKGFVKKNKLIFMQEILAHSQGFYAVSYLVTVVMYILLVTKVCLKGIFRE